LRALAAVADVHRSWNESADLAPDSPPASLPASTAPLDLPQFSPALRDRFLIERLLGKGGFGVVFKAYDRDRKAHIALKSLSRGDIGSVYDIKKEFRVLADLSHPNLVSLYELFADVDSWFIAMELVNGTDFLSYVGETLPVNVDGVVTPVARARRTVACDLERLGRALPQLAEALCYLHARQKLHCDVKPSNVLISRDGHLKVLDFGLATDLMSGRVGDTMPIRGTPAYVAPEQAEGGPAGPASDWYSVGVMLFEALTGERPFSGSFVQILEAKRHRDAPPPATVRHGVPDALDALCRDLLARDPEARPKDAASRTLLKGPSAPAEQMPFIGRSAQLDVLNHAFDGSTLGRPETVFVHGGSGMGKSALVRRFVDVLRERESDLVILEGRCYER
jgi:serine/threonine protein kinase